MRVKVIGPNLPNQSKGSFHVHTADCADLKRGWIKSHAAMEPAVDLDSVEEVVCYVYDNGIMDENPDLTWRDYVDEFHFAPCCSSLPYATPEPEPVRNHTDADVAAAIATTWTTINRPEVKAALIKMLEA